MEKIIILGKGGHARSVVDTIEREGKYEIAGYVVNDEELTQKEDDYPIIGKDEDLAHIYENGVHYAAMGIGYLGVGNLRRRLYESLKGIGYCLPVLCDPSAILSKKTQVEEGAFIGKGAIINAGATVGKMCIINSGTIIEHDCFVGDFSHIAVGAILCGNVYVGSDTLVGANATIIQGRQVDSGHIIGAGEVIRKNVLNGEVT